MDKVKSSLNNKVYYPKDSIRIINPKQAAYMWSFGCELLDIYPSKDYVSGDPIIVFVFDRKQTQDTGAYDSWCNNKPKKG